MIDNSTSENTACCKTGQYYDVTTEKRICLPDASNQILAKKNDNSQVLVCIRDSNGVNGETPTEDSNYPSGTKVICNGHIVLVNVNTQKYETPNAATPAVFKSYYNDDDQWTPQGDWAATPPSPSYYIHY